MEEMKSMKIVFRKGQETALITESVKESLEQKGFLSDVYRKAEDILDAYLWYADQIRGEMKRARSQAEKNSALYRSPQNIIAFSGDRGAGKTSTMMAFTKALEEGVIPSGKNKGRKMLIMDPIDPTMLENNQNILYVILSRMLKKAEEVWNSNMSCDRRYQDKEKEKNDILTLAKTCLSGINAIKDKKEELKTLADLQRVADSAVLINNFYDLVNRLCDFCISDSGKNESGAMLVLQIDDTDCQIEKGYELLEDIRKYLTIPNVVILMATDLNLMRVVLAQHYARAFDTGIKHNYIDEKKVMQHAEKNLSKMIPPANKLYLPSVDSIIKEKYASLDIVYWEEEKNLLENGGTFQTKILNYIFQKTHIAFKEHNSFLNNIIPTTLRGLTYFLNMLSSMKTVPSLDLELADRDVNEFSKKLREQLTVLEENLDIFEDYFMNEWCYAKLPPVIIDILEKMNEQVGKERITFANKEIQRYYLRKANKDSTENITIGEGDPYYELEQYLQAITGMSSGKAGAYRTQEDFYIVFALRTFLTIKNNRDALWLKKMALDDAQSMQNGIIVIDCENKKISLPNALYLPPMKIKNIEVVYGNHKQGTVQYNFTDGILACLEKKNVVEVDSDKKEVIKDNMKLSQLYLKQEFALLIACNYEMQEYLCDIAQEMAQESLTVDQNMAQRSGTTTEVTLERSAEEVIVELNKIIQARMMTMNGEMLHQHVQCEENPFLYIPYKEPIEIPDPKAKNSLVQDVTDSEEDKAPSINESHDN